MKEGMGNISFGFATKVDLSFLFDGNVSWKPYK
jgi:hypothetical protein